ncbi:NAD(P)-dependent dehydrogenase (short-subunit alcohol dehydrogenase family) [Kibdelosporangium banguiense]|uniref:NAD(P)-dependent dehydrogenase (Short-subunit alcohol dehydrogenase family) n=1 Tax=Kibdelosporangium banguiense TaxID=1365924 RepID=A0ABS4THD9_9PSEU|nr:SDR family oxidoreductase [Kibdelosporangium banguiense]MBP2323435.1 NAD(P)-dependent dehydrogenase (short-subunit alcohol dehydrogenase family) [Kibdelosporangium banguiense]
MIMPDFAGRAALVTGGTRGLGKAIAMEFARANATVFVTHRWGSVEETELTGEFDAAGLPSPVVVEADASDHAATRALMAHIKSQAGQLHAVVSNVSFAKVIDDMDDLKRSSMELSLGYSAWPVVDLVQCAHAAFGSYPRYVMAISSDGVEVCHDSYDLAGVSKAALETLCRYLAVRLKPQGVRVNVVRAGYVDTPSARAVVGDDVVKSVKDRPDILMDPAGVGRACVALSSGLLDAVTGQVLRVDEGMSLLGPSAFLVGRREPFEFPRDGAALVASIGTEAR